jgi:hypothetical protein
MRPRRSFLASLAALAAAPFTVSRVSAATSACYVSARLDPTGHAFASAFDQDGRSVFDVALPARGHSFAVHPHRPELLAPARRPGRFAQVIDVSRGTVLAALDSPAGRHFCGHAAFSADGRRLFTTETDYVTPRGVIGVYDATRGYVRVSEYDSHGLDPHDLRLLAGEVLVVANGGILTHPDAPGANLDPDGMDPSLAYLDTRDGRLLEQVRLPRELRQLSLRHLAIGMNGTVCVAMQYEGRSGNPPPLVATHVRGEAIRMLEVPPEVLATMQDYCGSATVDAAGRLLAVSCPKGNRSVFFDLVERRFLAQTMMPDGCGISAEPAPGVFMLTSGLGGAARFDVRTGRFERISGSLLDSSRWDNHLLRLPPEWSDLPLPFAEA